jgi:hypothetical protein
VYARGQRNTQRAADDREQDAFGQTLAHDAPAARANREPHGNLAPP